MNDEDVNLNKDNFDDEDDENKLKELDFLDDDGDLDFEAIKKRKKQKIEPLAKVDHSSIKYEAF